MANKDEVVKVTREEAAHLVSVFERYVLALINTPSSFTESVIEAREILIQTFMGEE